MYRAGHDRVLGIGVIILWAMAPVVRGSLREGQHPMGVAHQLVTDEAVKDDSVLLDWVWLILANTAIDTMQF